MRISFINYWKPTRRIHILLDLQFLLKKILILQEFEEFYIKWYKIIHRQATRKEERNYLTLHFDIDCEIALLCQKKDSYTDSVYSKNTLGTILTISQRLVSVNFHLLI